MVVWSASFRTVMLSMSFGSSMPIGDTVWETPGICPEAEPVYRGTPSTTQSGALEPYREDWPRIRTLNRSRVLPPESEEFSMLMPGMRPSSRLSTRALGLNCRSVEFTWKALPTISSRRCLTP